MYTIKHAAEQVGVSVSALRAWERRYGVGAAHRTEAGYRLYDDQAVRALRLMNSLVLDGWSVRAAAEEVHRRTRAAQALPPDVGPALGSVSHSDGGHPLVQVAESLDAPRLARTLDAGFTQASFETVVDSWLMPGLKQVGQAWQSRRITVAGEHLVAEAVARRLAGAYEAAGDQSAGPRAVIGLPPGSRHDLGLLAFATAARRQGVSTAYIGADVPVEDWVTAMTTGSPDCMVLAVPMESDAEPASRVIDAVRAQRPLVLAAVGGSAQDLVTQECLRLGHDLGAAARELAAHLIR